MNQLNLSLMYRHVRPAPKNAMSGRTDKSLGALPGANHREAMP